MSRVLHAVVTLRLRVLCRKMYATSPSSEIFPLRNGVIPVHPRPNGDDVCMDMALPVLTVGAFPREKVGWSPRPMMKPRTEPRPFCLDCSTVRPHIPRMSDGQCNQNHIFRAFFSPIPCMPESPQSTLSYARIETFGALVAPVDDSTAFWNMFQPLTTVRAP